MQLGSTGKKLGENLNLYSQSGNVIGTLGFEVCVGGEGSQEQKALPTLEELARLTR